MKIVVHKNTLGDLANDLAGIPPKAIRDMRKVVRSNAVKGNVIAKGYAKESAGSHGKLYPRAFSVESSSFAGGYSAEYGPDSAMPQGGMSFEGGSRNQPPHRDLAKSADRIIPEFTREVRSLPDGWFW